MEAQDLIKILEKIEGNFYNKKNDPYITAQNMRKIISIFIENKEVIDILISPYLLNESHVQ